MPITSRFSTALCFTDVVQEQAANYPESPAIEYVAHSGTPADIVSLSYRELDLAARQVAAALMRVCTPGDRALLLFPEGLDFAAAFLGCLYAGVIAVPSPLPGRYAHQQRRVAAIALDARPGAILTTAATRDEVRAFAGSSGQGQVPLLVLPLPDEAPAAALRPRRVDSLALLQYTSGSTGRPKGVMLTNGNIIANVANLVATFGLTAQTRLGGWVPHYHDMGLMALILPAWYTGSSATMMSPAAFLRRPVRWLEMVDNRNLTWSAGPNFAYDQCTRTVTDEQIASLDLSNWQYASNGSEPVRASILDAFAQRFAPAGFRREALNPCYGLAEATVFVSGTGCRAPVILRADEASLAAGILRGADTAEEHTATRDLVSNGTVRGLEILVVDPDSGEICGDGQIGELWLRGTSVGAGYWRNPGETERVFNATTADGRSGYLRTGDLGAIRNGELFVTGRIKELIIVRGRNIYPQDIEHIIREEIPDLRGLFGAAFSVTGADGDELLAVIHEIRPSTKADRLAGIGAEIRQAVARETGVTIMGLALVRRGTVRRTTSGKIQRLAMRDLFQAGEITALWSSVHPSMPTQPLQAPPERAW
ncbi:fatty acyl-AMP ligase [Nonomuraea sp. NPDC049400]|uniref:fatty acyl-AMP ligase n=1 Tax=Nonomuraea sp. NPDC049400 TaxID=3364352 RepID=UPI0037928758